ncbi:hypothetical protein GCM10027347_42630 [Larkinella harenae]
MNVSKLFDLITPFVLLALMGGMMILHGLTNLKEENIVLNFFFGVPLLIFPLVFHYLIRQVLNRNVLHVWLLESFLVASLGFLFFYVW